GFGPKKPGGDPWLARGSMGRDFLGEGWCWCGKRFIWEERNFWAVEFLLHAGGGSFFERGLHIERPTPVSPAGSVGSRQSATGARSPPSRRGNEWGRMTYWYGRGRLFDISHFKGDVPPLYPPRGRALPRTPSYE